MDEWDFDKRIHSAAFPSGDALHLAEWLRAKQGNGEGHPGSLAVQYGDFLATYGEDSRRNTVDIVVTCFFIDTASSILDYISVIAHVLKTGGVWVNAGPLHYHGLTRIPYAHQQLLRVISALGFEQQGPTVKLEATYCGEEEAFMKPDHYNFPLTVWKLVHKRDDILSGKYTKKGKHTCNVDRREGRYVPSVDYTLSYK